MDLRQLRYFSQVARREIFAGERGFARRTIGCDAADPFLEQEGVFAVRPHQAGRPADWAAIAARTLAAHPGEVAPAQGDASDRGACAERPACSQRALDRRLLFSRIAQIFLESYPKVQLSLQEGFTSSALGQLRRGELSLPIVTDAPLDPLIEYTPLFHASRSIWSAAPTSAPEERAPGEEPRRSSAGHDSRHNPLAPAHRELCGARRHSRSTSLELESGDTLLQLLQTGASTAAALLLDRGGRPRAGGSPCAVRGRR